MKKTAKLMYILLLISGVFVFFACEKEDLKKDDIPAEKVQQSDDGTEQREATDEAIDAALNSFGGTNLRTTGTNEDKCNYSTTLNEANKSITITFNGDNCLGNRKREGSITAKVTSEAKTYQQGGTLEITYNNFKVTRKSDNKSVTINGKMIVVNINGVSNPLIHTIHGSLKIKFDNGTERSWKVARRRTISFQDQVITWKIESDSTGYITEAGFDRNGNSFVTTIPSPLIIQNCTANDLKLIKGEIIYTVGAASLSADFGYTSLSGKTSDCSATGVVLTYSDSTTMARKYYPYKN